MNLTPLPESTNVENEIHLLVDIHYSDGNRLSICNDSSSEISYKE